MPTKTAAAKPAKPRAVPAKPANAVVTKPVAKPELAASTASAAEAAAKVALTLRVKDLVDRVTAAGEFKKKDVRDIIEATLAELGRALEDGYALNLPPFGKMHIRNNRVIDNGASAMTLKLRRGPAKAAGMKAGKEGLAEAGEAS